ncbi:hypothetical protein [Comamonas serinivorans]|nr:hypothetical protein [Comamonas serinivorans]
MHKFRPHSLHRLMARPRLKSEILSEGAKAFCREIAGQIAYGYQPSVTSKYLEKGLALEDEAIALYNHVFFTDLAKNTARRENTWLSGECDLYDGQRIRDIKTAWSLATFPKTSDDVHCTEYEWQMRAYMQLWDCDEAEVCYCLLDTPDDLIGHEDEAMHIVSEIPAHMRITSKLYRRDPQLERLMVEKIEAGWECIARELKQIEADHPA